MKRYILLLTIFILIAVIMYLSPFSALAETKAHKPPRILLLIAEQNIDKNTLWWGMEVDLGAAESAIADELINAGYEVLEPAVLRDEIEIPKAYRKADLSTTDAIELGSLAKSDMIIVGKAVASTGGKLTVESPEGKKQKTGLRSVFANISIKVISNKKVRAYLKAEGKSLHSDIVTGGREALEQAGKEIAPRIIEVLEKIKKGEKR